ncbi:MAG: hypothetical protein ACI86M_001606 [Saprospiraceae bacterium]|jgi:hypothetical protein
MEIFYDVDNVLDFEDEIEPSRTAEPVSPLQNERVEDQKQSKIIKDGSITLEVDSLEIAKRSIDSIVSATKAYYENEIYNGGTNQHRYTLKIRIPNSGFEAFMSSLKNGGGKMISKSVDARDVTGEYIDLEIRLKNNQAYLVQYRALLKRAKSIKDILEIEEKARRIESEIDVQLGRMKYINDEVRYSTLTLNVYQKHSYKKDVINEPTFLARVRDSAKFGFCAMQTIVLWMIALWPFFILLGCAYVARRMYQTRKRKS